MKWFFLKCLVVILFLTACYTLMAQPKGPDGNCTPKQKAELIVAAKNFFDWYRQEYPNMKKFVLVAKTGKGGSYRVQQRGVDSFLSKIQVSGLFNNEFIDSWKEFFKARDEHFRTHPQTKGVPLGFEYDLILFTKVVPEVLEKAKSFKAQSINYTEGAYLVEGEAKDWYMLYFKKEGNKWKICEVGNGDEE